MILTPLPSEQLPDGHMPLGILGSSVSPSRLPTEPVLARYYLQNVARRLLSGALARDGRGFAVCQCHRFAIPTPDADQKGVVQILANSHQKCHYGNLISCDSVWSCPVCASKITERRRLELQQIIDTSGRFKLMVTYTLSHQLEDKLEHSLDTVMGAFRKMFQGKGWVSFRKRWGWHAHVRTIEVTHGVNGWHPHVHLLAFFDNPLDSSQIKELEIELKNRWVSQLQSMGLFSNEADLWQYGLKVDSTDRKIADYVAKFGFMPSEFTLATYSKWNESFEMTKSPVKKGRYSGRTPFQLLLDYDAGDKQAGALFVEYAQVFKGRRQLEYSRSPDIRKELGIEIKTDEELSQEKEDTAYLFASLQPEEWKAVLKLNQRGELLQVAAAALVADDFTILEDFIGSLVHAPTVLPRPDVPMFHEYHFICGRWVYSATDIPASNVSPLIPSALDGGDLFAAAARTFGLVGVRSFDDCGDLYTRGVVASAIVHLEQFRIDTLERLLVTSKQSLSVLSKGRYDALRRVLGVVSRSGDVAILHDFLSQLE